MLDEPVNAVVKDWQSDPSGRIANISLAPNPKNSLFPLFEAIMNSIHAIEDRFGKDRLSFGNIAIYVIRNDEGDCEGFRIEDNGIGFTPDNLKSFSCMDSRKKAVIGGKGVGRLLWLKAAESVSVKSSYASDSGGVHGIQFDFCVERPINNYKEYESSEDNIGSVVTLYPYLSTYSKEIPRKPSTLANRILAHFISYFVNIEHPKIVLIDGDDYIDLFDQFSDSVDRDIDYKFSIEYQGIEKEFTLHCFLVPKSISDDEKSTNALYLGANGRAVRRFDMDAVIGLKAIRGKLAFIGYVEAELLDVTANETRTDFSLSADEVSGIVDKAKALIKEFLEPEIKEVRAAQAEKVSKLRIEHPRFLSVARDAKEFAETLHLSVQKDEDIFLEMSRASLRSYKHRKSAFEKSKSKGLPDVSEKARAYVEGLQSESISSLAEYVMKRKLILEAFEDSLKYVVVESHKSEYEDVLHGLICPLRSTSDDLDYEDHNLWILDDRLAFYSYFNSDKRMDSQIRNADHPMDRPDISVFDLGLGFANDDANQPITIIEFKRPKRDDYSLSDNPINQVRSYVEDMRKSGEAQKYDGAPLRAIGPETPFLCHIVADVTPTLKNVMKQLGPFHQKVGSNTYYKWDENYKIFIEISSFHDVLVSAKARNRAFFAKLDLD